MDYNDNHHIIRTTAQWQDRSIANVVIERGTLCIELVPGGKTKIKIGEGNKYYRQLPYVGDGSDLSDYYTKEEIDQLLDTLNRMAVASTIEYETYGRLPLKNNKLGDVRFVKNTSTTSTDPLVYLWNGSKWIPFSSLIDIDLSEYAKKSEVNPRLDSLEEKAHTHPNKSILDDTTASYTEAEQQKLESIEITDVDQNDDGDIVVTKTSGSQTVIPIPDEYELPIASESTLGGVRIGDGLEIDSNGVMSVTGGSGVTYTAGSGLTLNGTTFNHTDSVTEITTPGFYKLKYNATGHVTGTTAVTKSDITGLGIPESDTTYTFAEGSTNGAFTVTPSGGSEQTVTIHGLGSMAYESTSSFISSKPDGTTDFFNNDTIINSKYLPSYVDDVIEGYYYNGKFYEDSAHTIEITGESGKIYVDLSVTPAEPYRWSGTTFVSMKSPTISAVADVVYKSNGVITKSFTDGSASADVTVYTHPDTAGNIHIPSGGSTGQILVYGGTSGTAVWSNPAAVPELEPAPDSSTAGEAGIAPAPGPETYAAGTAASPYRHYLRADATWSDDPVTEYDTLTLNVVAAS